ncbi:unnamed protein product [marine sediment metagenome]|uniref:Uncharacterized protein n=1 Tax=marine sediment metagenome TaxID=412755 RepID=X0ZMB8_9ZZZZ
MNTLIKIGANPYKATRKDTTAPILAEKKGKFSLKAKLEKKNLLNSMKPFMKIFVSENLIKLWYY